MTPYLQRMLLVFLVGVAIGFIAQRAWGDQSFVAAPAGGWTVTNYTLLRCTGAVMPCIESVQPQFVDMARAAGRTYLFQSPSVDIELRGKKFLVRTKDASVRCESSALP